LVQTLKTGYSEVIKTDYRSKIGQYEENLIPEQMFLSQSHTALLDTTKQLKVTYRKIGGH
jgi:hypothetical protein